MTRGEKVWVLQAIQALGGVLYLFWLDAPLAAMALFWISTAACMTDVYGKFARKFARQAQVRSPRRNSSFEFREWVSHWCLGFGRSFGSFKRDSHFRSRKAFSRPVSSRFLENRTGNDLGERPTFQTFIYGWCVLGRGRARGVGGGRGLDERARGARVRRGGRRGADLRAGHRAYALAPDHARRRLRRGSQRPGERERERERFLGLNT